jgi:hypothetical protein
MKFTSAALIALLIIGFFVSIVGYLAMERKTPMGLQGELWLEDDSILDPNSVRLAWGVRAPPEKTPDGWVFCIRLKANGSFWLRSIWHETNSVFYEWYGNSLETTLTIRVDEKTSAMEWTWYLYNPSSSAIRLQTFHVNYAGVRHPLRLVGAAIIIGGAVLVAVSLSRLIRGMLR